MTRTELLTLHDETCRKCKSIMEKKNNDYAGSGQDDPFKNFKMASSFGIHPVQGILLRIGDKLQRVNTFAQDGKLAVANESVDDALEDVINYCILAKGMIQQQRNTKDIPCHAGNTSTPEKQIETA